MIVFFLQNPSPFKLLTGKQLRWAIRLCIDGPDDIISCLPYRDELTVFLLLLAFGLVSWGLPTLIFHILDLDEGFQTRSLKVIIFIITIMLCITGFRDTLFMDT